MKVAITGAGGFVGEKLAEHFLRQESEINLTLMDLKFPDGYLSEVSTQSENIRYVKGELQNPAIQDELLAGGVDVLYHLAAVPGGTAEANPELSKSVNLDATLSLFQKATDKNNRVRIVYTSTIAVFGAELPALVDDATPVQPALVYGSHKAMVELAIADMHRRGVCEAVAIRLPGIVARPYAPNGLKSAFMSNVFHCLKQGEPFVSPVSESATFWIMSVKQCVKNLVTAGTEKQIRMPESRVVTLPALRMSMGELLTEIQEQTGASKDLVSFKPEKELELTFGSYPMLETPNAFDAGFGSDENITALVSAALNT
jgi:nucleoside-diphosphate-sugar epimerase